MSRAEGVIRFDLQFTPAAPLPWSELRELEGWRRVMHRLGLVGRDPARYDGAGYGNVSRRLPPFDGAAPRFAVSGSQTGDISALGAGHYALVTDCDPAGNRVVAEGPVAPSSESLTHGMLYRLDPSLRFVFHVHAPEIWRRAAALGLPVSAAAAGYGTPQMAAEVVRLFRERHIRGRGVLVMGGHEDGVVAFGETAEAAGCTLLAVLGRALVR